MFETEKLYFSLGWTARAERNSGQGFNDWSEDDQPFSGIDKPGISHLKLFSLEVYI